MDALCTSCLQFNDVINKFRLPHSLGEEYLLDLSQTPGQCVLCRFLNRVEGEPITKRANFRPGFWLKSIAFGKHGTVLVKLGRKNDSRKTFVISDLNIRSQSHLSSPDYGVIKEWLADCGRYHSRHCRTQRYVSIPHFKVIDVNTRQVVTAPLQPHSSSQAPIPYVALSYVWGNVSANVAFSGSTLPNSLPAVVEDAISVVKALGYNFLWIDRYCIPQDDTKAKHAQIQNMGSIFHFAELTIVASRGANPRHGLNGLSRPRTIPFKLKNMAFIPGYTEVRNEVLASKWNSRGWTYQECMLSRRVLVFTSTQCYFQCNTMFCLEHSPMDLESMVHIRETHKMPEWADDVEPVFPFTGSGAHGCDLATYVAEFSVRSLTFDTDRLHAIRGVFKDFERKNPGVRVFQGLPIETGWVNHTSSLSYGLSWHPTTIGIHERISSFPSWSWLAWKTTLTKTEVQRGGVAAGIYLRRGNALEHQHSLVEVCAVSPTSNIVPWETNMNDVLGTNNEGDSITSLGLCGWSLCLVLPRGESTWTDGPFSFTKKDFLSIGANTATDRVMGIMVHLTLEYRTLDQVRRHPEPLFRGAHPHILPIYYHLRNYSKEADDQIRVRVANIGIMLIREESRTSPRRTYTRCGWIDMAFVVETLPYQCDPENWRNPDVSPAESLIEASCIENFEWIDILLS